MCNFPIATLPAGTSLPELEASIPVRLRLSLIRHRNPHCNMQARHIGFTPVEFPSLAAQLPNDDQIVRLSRVACDCWSTLGCKGGIDPKEDAKWQKIFAIMLQRIERFGLVIHFGDFSNEIDLLGPHCISLSDGTLAGLAKDTYYEVMH